MSAIRQSYPRRALRVLGIALLAAIAAVLVRKLLLGAPETRIVWVTFYPAVVVAAYFGGWIAGVSTAGLSCLIALFGRPMLRQLLETAGLEVRVSEADPALGGVLERRARRLQYSVILRALKSCRGGAQAEGGAV
jgi:membrane protein implicated in regulation of membrane protease activity